MMEISAAEFKARCLKLMDRVAKTRESIVITKRGRAVAQLVPVPGEPKSLFGYMKGTVTFKGDMVSPTEEVWSVLTGEEDYLHEHASPTASSARGKARRKTGKR